MDTMSSDDKNSDYAEISSEECSSIYEIERDRVDLGDILGAGQFGDVFRGILRDKDLLIPIAVKSCKLEREEEMAEKLLQEAGIMEQFDHEHIIRFYGVCSTHPVWIIMELAELGEIKKFLRENKECLHVEHLILYCHQLSTAMHYLECRHIVHRDIAARNVLVSSWNCVKLADFGLSRWLSETNYYTASKSMKLPIKWMAPESINYRRFTTASDVWMFAVCMWEILTYGEKPFTGVNNSDVIQLLESGVRLPLPSTAGCPPSIYLAMCACWQFSPEQRPKFADIEHRVLEILLDERRITEAELPKNRVSKTHSHGLSMDTDHPPDKPAHPLSRKHSGFVGRSTPELDAVNRCIHADVNRSQLPHPAVWKSVNALHDQTENRLTGNFCQRPLVSHDGNISSQPSLEETLRRQQMQSHIDSSWLKVMVEDKVTSQERVPESGFLVRYIAEETESKRTDNVEQSDYLSKIVLDRTADDVYSATIDVVKAVTEMIHNVDASSRSNVNSICPMQLYSSMIMNIGVKLKTLITSVDNVLFNLPADSKTQIIMATNVLNSDMASVINRMKLAQQYSNTVLDKEYQKAMLQAGHALAVDSRNLLDAVDNARKKQIYLRTECQQSDSITDH